MSSVQVFMCPDCDLVMSEMETVRCSDDWSEWRCWRCAHVFGGMCDHGSLDLGIVGP